MVVCSSLSIHRNHRHMRGEGGLVCAVCGAVADGIHYSVMSCRSCNAFFRRTVVEKAVYHCKNSNLCVIDADGRCGCRSCRYNKCLQAGMKVAAVQPRRDPTGSQKDRRKRSLTASQGDSRTPPDTPTAPSGWNQQAFCDSISSQQKSHTEYQIPTTLLEALETTCPGFEPRRGQVPPAIAYGRSDQIDSDMHQISRVIKREADDDELPSTSMTSSSGPRSASVLTLTDAEEQEEFQYLTFAYKEHSRMMKLSFTTTEQFMKELSNGVILRQMEPNDVEKLSNVELAGLLYWIEKLKPFTTLPEEDRDALLKRYSVRKLSLDHFYVASQHPQEMEKKNFVMNNYTYVPPNRTGFELPGEDCKIVQAKRETFDATFERFWRTLILPFAEMKITEAEIVYLHMMLLWSPSNNEHVSQSTRDIMKTRRDWGMRRLFEWYNTHGYSDAGLRFGQVTLLLGEVELICDMHCQDFQVAKLFDLLDMSDYWYEETCYSDLNTLRMQYDPALIENIKRLTALGLADLNAKELDRQRKAKEKEERLAAAARIRNSMRASGMSCTTASSSYSTSTMFELDCLKSVSPPNISTNETLEMMATNTVTNDSDEYMDGFTMSRGEIVTLPSPPNHIVYPPNTGIFNINRLSSCTQQGPSIIHKIEEGIED